MSSALCCLRDLRRTEDIPETKGREEEMERFVGPIWPFIFFLAKEEKVKCDR